MFETETRMVRENLGSMHVDRDIKLQDVFGTKYFIWGCNKYYTSVVM